MRSCRLKGLDAYNLKCFNVVLHVLFSLMLIVVELIGDLIPNARYIQWELRLIMDNGVHGAIAALSWLIVVDYHSVSLNRTFYEVLLCGSLGSLIDLDHFIEARSFHFKVNRFLYMMMVIFKHAYHTLYLMNHFYTILGCCKFI